MNRRTFVLLTSAAARALARPRRSRFPSPDVGQLRFALDDERRWSLSHVTDTESRVLIQNATLGAWIADRFVSLADLEYSALGDRRFPTGRSLIVRGRSAGLWMEAEFFAGTAALATVSLRLFPDSGRPAIGGTRFFQTAPADLLPGPGPLLALVNGYDSPSATSLLDASAGDFTSCGTLGLTRGSEGLGLAFDGDDPGDGVVTLTGSALDAASRFAPTRPLRTGGDTSVLKIGYAPHDDGLAALATALLPQVPGDRDRLTAAVALAGWRPDAKIAGASEFAARLDACTRLDPRYGRAFELGDGYQRAAGDWDTNERFPQGHRALTDQIHARGLRAGLWLAPFAVSERSGIPAAHENWLLKAQDGKPKIWGTRDEWGGTISILDGANLEVQHWLADLANLATTTWGYDYLALDWLSMATVDARRSDSTRAEAYRAGLAALRRGAGDAFLAATRAPLQHAAGLVNSMRVDVQSDSTWDGFHAAARTAAQRTCYHRASWLNDPAFLTVAAAADPEAELRASLAAVSGGLTFCTDDLTTLSADRLAVLARTMPVLASAGRPVALEADGQAWVTQGATGWWTVVVINWSDHPAALTVPFDALNIPPGPCTVYDVWRDAPLPTVTTSVSVTLDPHSSVTLGLRVSSSLPHVVGSTRHVVQGAELADETWSAAERTLGATSAHLDRRPYAITIAVPRGLEVTDCNADPQCAITTLASGHVVLNWTAGEGGDVQWALKFRTRG